MKKIILTLFAFVAINSVSAQTFEKGTKVVQIGIGLGGDIGTPIGASAEYGISDKIGVGVYLGYASKSYSGYFGTGDYKVTSLLFGARGNYHFYQSDKLDTYGGVILGFNSAKAKYSGAGSTISTPSYGGAVFGGQVGARYYFTDSISAFGELGYGIGFLNIGVALKF